MGPAPTPVCGGTAGLSAAPPGTASCPVEDGPLCAALAPLPPSAPSEMTDPSARFSISLRVAGDNGGLSVSLLSCREFRLVESTLSEPLLPDSAPRPPSCGIFTKLALHAAFGRRECLENVLLLPRLGHHKLLG